MTAHSSNRILSVVMRMLRFLVPNLWYKADQDVYCRETITYGGVAITFASWFHFEQHPFKKNRNYRTRITATIRLNNYFEDFDLIFWMPGMVDVNAQWDQVLDAMLDSVECNQHRLDNHSGCIAQIEARLQQLLKYRKETIATQSYRSERVFREIFINKINPFNGASLQKHE